MDDLNDVIQDAAYIGELCDSRLRPTAPLKLPSVEDALEWAKKAQRRNEAVLSVERVLSEPLGWYLYRKFLCSVGSDAHMALDFVADVQSYSSISTPASRLNKAAEIIAQYFKRRARPAAASEVSEKGGISTPTHAAMTPTAVQVGAASQPYEIEEGASVETVEHAGKPFWWCCASVKTAPFNPSKLDGVHKQDVLFRPGMGIHAAIRSRQDAGMMSTITMTASEAISEASLLNVVPSMLEPVKRIVEGHALAKITDGGTVIYEARERDLAAASGTGDVGLPRNLFNSLRDVVFQILYIKHWQGFKDSSFFQTYLRFKALEQRSVTIDDFTLFRVLGRGGFGVVNGCKKKDTGHLYAMKTMNKHRIKQKNASDLCWNERSVLGEVDSPFVISLKYAFSTEDDLVLVLDLATGGDLAFHLARQVRFPENRARFYAAQILLGIEHLHSLHIVYRDLKPENILLDNKGNAKISDLGLATRVSPTLCGRCGTRGYWAPEMLVRIDGRRQTYGFAVDWWSFGCLLYEFLSGKCPFRTEMARSLDPDKHKSMDKATMHLEVNYDERYFSPAAKSLISGLLVRDPSRRLGARGATDVKEHPFFESIDWGLLEAGLVPAPWLPETCINAVAQDMIGGFEDASKKVVLSEEDQAKYKGWEITNKQAFQQEVVDYLVCEDRDGPLLAKQKQSWCTIM